MIKKQRQKSKKPATVSRPREKETDATLQDPSKDKNAESVQMLQTVLSWEQIPATSNDATLFSHSSADILKIVRLFRPRNKIVIY